MSGGDIFVLLLIGFVAGWGCALIYTASVVARRRPPREPWL